MNAHAALVDAPKEMSATGIEIVTETEKETTTDTVTETNTTTDTEIGTVVTGERESALVKERGIGIVTGKSKEGGLVLLPRAELHPRIVVASASVNHASMTETEREPLP